MASRAHKLEKIRYTLRQKDCSYVLRNLPDVVSFLIDMKGEKKDSFVQEVRKEVYAAAVRCYGCNPELFVSLSLIDSEGFGSFGWIPLGAYGHCFSDSVDWILRSGVVSPKTQLCAYERHYDIKDKFPKVITSVDKLLSMKLSDFEVIASQEVCIAGRVQSITFQDYSSNGERLLVAPLPVTPETGASYMPEQVFKRN